MREIFSLDLERSPLKNDRIFMNSDWMITVTANERESCWKPKISYIRRIG